MDPNIRYRIQLILSEKQYQKFANKNYNALYRVCWEDTTDLNSFRKYLKKVQNYLNLAKSFVPDPEPRRKSQQELDQEVYDYQEELKYQAFQKIIEARFDNAALRFSPRKRTVALRFSSDCELN